MGEKGSDIKGHSQEAAYRLYHDAQLYSGSRGRR
nr:MAG TPA: hypothetical protein [Caudoviricetes sp.]